MMNNNYSDLKYSTVLFELTDHLNFIIKLNKSDKLPKVLMLSGKKGIGKCTLVNHFMSYIFDKENYNLEEKIINDKSIFYKQYTNNTFPNIVYLSANKFKNVKIEDIRNLKSLLLKSTISNNKRFIILDDIEVFNHNSLNALLKIIEEPSDSNFFLLINNNTKPLLKTIKKEFEKEYIKKNENPGEARLDKKILSARKTRDRNNQGRTDNIQGVVDKLTSSEFKDIIQPTSNDEVKLKFQNFIK